jgi:1-acyl-sn-glycerol-3-phosphate acyltransferase
MAARSQRQARRTVDDASPETRPPARPGFASSIARWMVAAPINVVVLSLCTLLGVVSLTAAHRLLVWLCRVDFRVFGLEVSLADANRAYPERGLIVVYLNQTSLIETVILPWMCPRPAKGILNVEFALIPFFGWVQAVRGRVLVRQWPAQAKRQLRRAARDLRRGACYFISIEGNRSRDGRLQPFKKGPVVMAIEGKADLLPVIIEGARDRLPYGHWRVAPGRVHVRRLPLISTEGLVYEDRDRIVAELRALAEQHLRVEPRHTP